MPTNCSMYAAPLLTCLRLYKPERSICASPSRAASVWPPSRKSRHVDPSARCRRAAPYATAETLRPPNRTTPSRGRYQKVERLRGKYRARCIRRAGCGRDRRTLSARLSRMTRSRIFICSAPHGGRNGPLRPSYSAAKSAGVGGRYRCVSFGLGTERRKRTRVADLKGGDLSAYCSVRRCCIRRADVYLTRAVATVSFSGRPHSRARGGLLALSSDIPCFLDHLRFIGRFQRLLRSASGRTKALYARPTVAEVIAVQRLRQRFVRGLGRDGRLRSQQLPQPGLVVASSISSSALSQRSMPFAVLEPSQ